MTRDAAETRRLAPLLQRVGHGLDDFLRFEHPDAMQSGADWRRALDRPLPADGIGIDAMTDELLRHVVPHGAAMARPGFTSFVTTGAVTASVLATAAAGIAAPQRYWHTAFNFLEGLSLRWLSELFGLRGMEGVYSSGGSVANLLALGAARQHAFEHAGHDPAADGIHRPVALYASTEAHHTIQRAAGVLGMGRRAVRAIPCDDHGRMRVDALDAAMAADRVAGVLPVAVVATAGTTNTGAIDPLGAVGALAARHGVWFHVDGAYGLPGVLDPRVAPLYAGLERADSVIVDPHKWLGAAVGITATFVRDRELLRRAFTQEPAVYLEGSMRGGDAAPRHSLEGMGVPYHDMGVELSAPSRGVVVWALLREIGAAGLAHRVQRHNDLARRIAQRANRHPRLQLMLEPTLSICCFRYVAPGVDDLDALNERLHRCLLHENRNLPSTTRVRGRLALRPCFVGARSGEAEADSLVDDVLRIGADLVSGRAHAPMLGVDMTT